MEKKIRNETRIPTKQNISSLKNALANILAKNKEVKQNNTAQEKPKENIVGNPPIQPEKKVENSSINSTKPPEVPQEILEDVLKV